MKILLINQIDSIEYQKFDYVPYEYLKNYLKGFKTNWNLIDYAIEQNTRTNSMQSITLIFPVSHFDTINNF